MTEWLRAGSEALDQVLGGGWPRGAIVELCGVRGSGKQSLALATAAKAQELGLSAGWWEVVREQKPRFDTAYADACGWSEWSNLKFGYQHHDESLSVLEAVEHAVDQGPALLVVDGAGYITSGHRYGERLVERVVMQRMRSLVGAVMRRGVVLLMLVEPLVVGDVKLGLAVRDPKQSPIRTALKFYAGVRVLLSAREESGEGLRWVRGQAQVAKNKFHPPFGVAEYRVQHGVGLLGR